MSNFSIIFQKNAISDLKEFNKKTQKEILFNINKWLLTTPYISYKRRVKKLVNFRPPLYRLRISSVRVYYRVKDNQVIILGIIKRKESDRWLKGVK